MNKCTQFSDVSAQLACIRGEDIVAIMQGCILMCLIGGILISVYWGIKHSGRNEK